MPACLLTGKLPRQNGITGNDLAKGRQVKAKRLLGNSLMLPKTLTEAGYLTFQSGKHWNTTFKDVGFTHGMTDTARRHGDAGLNIGREGMGPIFEFIDLAKKRGKTVLHLACPIAPSHPSHPSQSTTRTTRKITRQRPHPRR